MKKKNVWIGVVGCLAVIAIVGGTFASFRTSTEGNAGTGITEITTKSIDITALGEMQQQEEITKAAMPGKEYSCRYKVKNNVESQKAAYSVYARVKVYKQWEDPALDAAGVQLGMKDQTGTFVPYAERKEQDITTTGWLITHQDDEEIVLYYTKPLQKGEASPEFLDAVKLTDTLGNTYTDQKLNIKFEVTAVQSDLGTDAIAAEWGVFPKIAPDGTIESISETK